MGVATVNQAGAIGAVGAGLWEVIGFMKENKNTCQPL